MKKNSQSVQQIQNDAPVFLELKHPLLLELSRCHLTLTNNNKLILSQLSWWSKLKCVYNLEYLDNWLKMPLCFVCIDEAIKYAKRRQMK